MEKIIVKHGKNIVFLNSEEIGWIEAARNYVRVNCGDRDFCLRQSLGEIEKKLDSIQFVRVNRSTIINISRIKEVQTRLPKKTVVVIDQDHYWNWGRQFKKNLLSMLERQMRL